MSKQKRKRQRKNVPKPQANEDMDLFDLEPIEVKKVPTNQLTLTEAQLKEQFTKTLLAVDPKKPERSVRFDYTEGEFQSEVTMRHLSSHFHMMGKQIHVKSSSYKDQKWDQEWKKANVNLGAQSKHGKTQEEEMEETDMQSPRRQQRLIKNQFNFSERAAQTFNLPMRDRAAATEPPPITIFSQTVNKSEIFDSYLSELLRNRQAEKQDKKGPRGDKKEKTTKKQKTKIKYTDKNTQVLNSAELLRSTKFMERVVNMNAEKAIYQDFRYFEGDSENQGVNEDFLLPLWSIQSSEVRKKVVTAIAWNTMYADLFAVGYGSYDFMRQTKGLICIYSLKNTSNAEYTINLQSGVVCMDFHPDHCNLLVVGTYNGMVSVFDVRMKSDSPIYMSNSPENRHTDPVWNVRWNPVEIGMELNFYTISSDGRVVKWNMSQNELQNEDVMELQNVIPKTINEEDSNLLGLASACCFDWSAKSEGIFLVGTEEGQIHQCNRAYTQNYVRSYTGHDMPVYAVKWNPFHPTIFLSCSEDWSVKLWDSEEIKPIITYDLNHPVGDVSWAPFSSTVFAAVTVDGKAHVFDLGQNKNGPLTSHRVIKKGGLTHVAFSTKDDIIVVGDDRGIITVLKLDANVSKRELDQNKELDHKHEKEKLEKIILVTGSKVMDLSHLHEG